MEIFRAPAGGANGTLIDPERPSAGLRSAGAARHPHGDGWLHHSAGRPLRRQALQLAQRSLHRLKGPHLLHRSALRPRDNMEMKVEGVYRIDAPGKVTRIIAHEVDRPNGILVSPGDRYLYVADNNNNNVGGARKLWRFDLKADGTIDPRSRKLIFDWRTSRGPDGFKMDHKGRLYVAAGLNKAESAGRNG